MKTLKGKVWLFVFAGGLALAACDDSNAGQNNVTAPDSTQNLSLPFIAVDLDGDGIEIIPLEKSQVFFDMDGDGLAERTAWVGPDDGILMVYDPQIDMIKDTEYEPEKKIGLMANGGIAALKKLDTNNDGYIEQGFSKELDKVLGGPWLWQDKNQNGFPDKGEELTAKTMPTPQKIYLPVEEKSPARNNFGQVTARGRMELAHVGSRGYEIIEFLFSDDNVEWIVPPIKKE